MLVYIAAEFAATLFPDDNMFTLGSGGPNDNDNYTNPTLSQITAYAYFVICLPDTTPESLNVRPSTLSCCMHMPEFVVVIGCLLCRTHLLSE